MEVALRERCVLEQLAVAVAVAVGGLDLARGVKADPELLLSLGQLEAVRGATGNHDVVALAEGNAPEHRAQDAAAAVDVDHLVALAVSVEALERLGGLGDRDLDIPVPHEQPPAADRIAPGLDRVGVGEAMDVGLRHPLLALDGREGADGVEAAGRLEVQEDRLVAREALVAHDLLDQQRRAAAIAAHLYVALARYVTQRRVAHQRFPRLSCSRSMASNRALKLPSPKPRAPWRSMISKKTVGRSPIGLVKICSR